MASPTAAALVVALVSIPQPSRVASSSDPIHDSIARVALTVPLEGEVADQTANTSEPGSAQRNRSQSGPVFLVGAEYAGVTELTGNAGILIPLGDQEKHFDGDVAQGRRGLGLTASAGTGGFQFAGGFSEIANDGNPPLFVGFDLRATIGKIGSGGSSPHSTYVGLDAGYTFLHVRGSLGVAYRLDGASGRSRWMFAPSIGIVIPVGRW